MKKALAGILVFIALTNIVGFMPLYFSLLQEIKSEVNLQLAEAGDLQKLVISEADYHNKALFNTTDENEFSFKGRMYDYKSVTRTSEGYVFSVLEDNRESGLVDFLKAAFNGGNDNAKSSKSPLAELFKNFSKDFLGSFGHTVLLAASGPVTRTVYLTEPVRSGYDVPRQNPPDFYSCPVL